MLLAMAGNLDPVFQEAGFPLPFPSEFREMIENMNIFYVSKTKD